MDLTPIHCAFLVLSLVELGTRLTAASDNPSYIRRQSFSAITAKLFDLILANMHGDLKTLCPYTRHGAQKGTWKMALTATAERAATGFVSILDLRQPSAEEIKQLYTCPDVDYVPRTKKLDVNKKRTNGSRHRLLPAFDLVDVIGKLRKQALDVPESGNMLWNALIVNRRVVECPPCRGGAQECPLMLLNFGAGF